ncbi:MAG: hypothetical protein ACLVKN_17960 [Flavonifractor plautii]
MSWRAMLLALACGGGTNETPPLIPRRPRLLPETLPKPRRTGSPPPPPTPAPVTQLYYSSDVAELEGAWTLAQVYANGETLTRRWTPPSPSPS